ncbi:alpha/beta hydrolase [Catalinimonas sp. 4WD22]|uniref:alpha/beta hydrolase n=1 Tax=Catalinimonas locisalis TaxID=3133978 RepID=UPI00310153F1
MIKLFFGSFFRKKANASPELNINLSRHVVFSFPPKKIYKNNQVKTCQIEGHNIFTIIPTAVKNDQMLFYLHGGAYKMGITYPHWSFINKIAVESGTTLTIMDYPIAPNSGYKETFHWVLAAYQALSKEVDASKIILMGDSAGGGLTLALAQHLKQVKRSQPKSMILLSPWLDVTMKNPEINFFEKRDKFLSKRSLIESGKLYARGEDRKNYMISPIYGDLNGLADIYLFIGGDEILVADARKLRELSKEAKVNLHYYEFEEMFHVWMLFPVPEAKKVRDLIHDIIMMN